MRAGIEKSPAPDGAGYRVHVFEAADVIALGECQDGRAERARATAPAIGSARPFSMLRLRHTLLSGGGLYRAAHPKCSKPRLDPRPDRHLVDAGHRA